MHYYKEGHSFFGQDVTVVGGKNSAIEATIDLYRSGANVSLVHRVRLCIKELNQHYS